MSSSDKKRTQVHCSSPTVCTQWSSSVVFRASIQCNNTDGPLSLSAPFSDHIFLNRFPAIRQLLMAFHFIVLMLLHRRPHCLYTISSYLSIRWTLKTFRVSWLIIFSWTRNYSMKLFISPQWIHLLVLAARSKPRVLHSQCLLRPICRTAPVHQCPHLSLDRNRMLNKSSEDL